MSNQNFWDWPSLGDFFIPFWQTDTSHMNEENFWLPAESNQPFLWPWEQEFYKWWGVFLDEGPIATVGGGGTSGELFESIVVEESGFPIPDSGRLPINPEDPAIPIILIAAVTAGIFLLPTLLKPLRRVIR